MAENIRVAKFDIDTDELVKRLTHLKHEMGEVRGEMTSSRKAVAELSQWHRISAEQVAKLEKENKTNTRAYQSAKATLDDLTKSLNEENKKLVENEVRLKNINAEYRVGANVLNSYQKSVETTTTKQDEANKALQTEITSIAVARANNTQLLAIRNQLNPAIEEEAKLIEQLNERLDSNNNFVKENASAYERQKINIGNYRNDIIEASNDLNIFNGGLGNFIQKSQEAGGVGNFLSNSLSAVGKGVVGVTRASLAFIATPIGAVIAAIAGGFLLVQNALNRSEESTNKLKTAMAPLTGIFQAILKALEPLGKFIIDGLVFAFEKATKAIQTTIRLVGGALASLGFSETSQSVLEFANSMEEATKTARELALAEQELENAQRKSRLTQLEYQKEAEKFRQIRDDESLSIQERIKANEELGKVLNAQLQEELRLARVALDVANLRIKQEGRTKEALDAQYEALTEIADIEERINGQRSEQLTNINSLRREAEAQQKAAHDERMRQIDAEITRMNESLNLWLAQQGVKARTLEEELEIERKLAEDSIKILDYQLKYKKISQEQYATEVLNIQNELAMMTNQLVVENAERELAEFMRLNEERLEKGKIYSDEEIQNEKDKLAELERLEREYVQLRLDNGLINKLEFDDAMLELDKKYLEERNSLYETYDTAQRIRELADRDLQHQKDLLDMEERGATEFERKQYQIDQHHQMELEKMLERAEAEGWTEEQINEGVMVREQMWNAERLALLKTTEEEMMNFRIATAQNTAAMIGAIAGKESALGKAVAIASIIQEKARAITAIWANISAANAKAKFISPATFGQPWVGINTAFAVAQTGATVGLAAKSINEIRSAGTKKMYTGGFTGFGGKFETAPVEIHREEFVLNAEATRRIGLPALYAMNSGASNNGFVQDSIMGSTVSIKPEDILAIAEGVARGASVGSAQGIRDLSTDREIMNNSKF